MEIVYFESLVSTNDTAKAAARAGAKAFYTVAAGYQTAGRGRKGRAFASPAGGTYFSTVLRPTFSREKYGAITPFAALAVHRAVTDILGISLDIKWINDLLWQGKKVCGILAEAGEDQNGTPFVVLGIGINTGHCALPADLADIAIHLPYNDPKALIERILFYLQSFEAEIEAGTWLAAYRARLCCLGKRVLVIGESDTMLALALDVHANGGLVVRYEDGTCEILTGSEISLRLAEQ